MVSFKNFFFKLHFLLLFATFYLLDWYCNVLKGPQYFLLPPCMIMQFVSWHLKKLREFECSRADSRLSSTKCYGFKPGFCHSVTLWMQVGGAAQFKAGFCDWRDTRCSECFSSVLCFSSVCAFLQCALFWKPPFLLQIAWNQKVQPGDFYTPSTCITNLYLPIHPFAHSSVPYMHHPTSRI